MQKTTLLFSFLLLSLLLKAQIPNASFEQTDSSGKIATWQSVQGKSTQLSSAQFGVIPFTPFHGNFFVLLEPDTQTANIKKGIIEQSFAFADTPGSVMFSYFYIPESLNQHAQIELFMSKWNGSSHDTILSVTDTIAAVADSNQIRIQWNMYAKTLTGFYRQQILPDTAIIRFITDDGIMAGKNVRLYLDMIQFSRWPVGINENIPDALQVYPNPANKQFFATGDITNADCVLISLDGKQYQVETTQTGNRMNLDVGNIPSGFYILKITTNRTVLTKRIVINHD